jgi:hypothetical protein
MSAILYSSPGGACCQACFDCILRLLPPGTPWPGACSVCNVPYPRNISYNKQAFALAQIVHDSGVEVRRGDSSILPAELQSAKFLTSPADDSVILTNARTVLAERLGDMSREIARAAAQPRRQTRSGLDTATIQQLCHKINGRTRQILDQYEQRHPSTWTPPVIRTAPDEEEWEELPMDLEE